MAVAVLSAAAAWAQMPGMNMPVTAEEALKLEDTLKRDPDDLDAHKRLAQFFVTRLAMPGMREQMIDSRNKYMQHASWLIAKHPAAAGDAAILITKPLVSSAATALIPYVECGPNIVTFTLLNPTAGDIEPDDISYSALWLDLIRQLSYTWSTNEQYAYGWFVPIFAAALLAVASLPAEADKIALKGGGGYEGRLVRETDKEITLAVLIATSALLVGPALLAPPAFAAEDLGVGEMPELPADVSPAQAEAVRQILESDAGAKKLSRGLRVTPRTSAVRSPTVRADEGMAAGMAGGAKSGTGSGSGL
mgnify:CR=1 FL=1